MRIGLIFCLCIAGAFTACAGDGPALGLEPVVSTDYGQAQPAASSTNAETISDRKNLMLERRVPEDCVIDLTVGLKNPTSRVIEFETESHGWRWQWTSSNPDIRFPGLDENWNIRMKVVVRPHETYTFDEPLVVCVKPTGKAHDVTFKMGFSTDEKVLFKSPKDQDFAWSAPITVHMKE